MSQNNSSRLITDACKWFLPVEMSHLFWLSTHDFLPAKPVEGAQCRVLLAEDINRLSTIKDFGLSPEAAVDFERQDGLAVGMYVLEKLVGLCLFLGSNIVTTQSERCKRFQGIAIELPPGTRYLYKAFVLPEYRGQRLNSAMVRYAIGCFDTARVHTLVTMASVTNKSFVSSVLNQGFESVGVATETVIFGKHIYHLPKSVDSQSGQMSTEAEGCIVFQAPRS